MPISFYMHHDKGYFEVKYKGPISDSELLEAWKSYLNSDDWVPGSDRFVDVSEAVLSGLSSSAIQELAGYIDGIFKQSGAPTIKVAVYAPGPLHYGLSSVYRAFAEESVQHVELFRDRKEAIRWLRNGGQP